MRSQLDGAARSASELHVLARRSELGVARKYAEDVAAAFGLDADSRYEFVYAVNEAVTNAIRHGAEDHSPGRERGRRPATASMTLSARPRRRG